MKRTKRDQPGEKGSGGSGDPGEYFSKILQVANKKEPDRKKLRESSRDEEESEKSTTEQGSKSQSGPPGSAFPIKLPEDPRAEDAFAKILQSKEFEDALREIAGDGAVMVVLDKLPAGGAWNSYYRTITLDPEVLEQKQMTVLGGLAFELMNAAHDKLFRPLVDDARKGCITDPDEFATACEKIEYQSAERRANASLKMIKAGIWQREDDPQARHFLKEDERVGPVEGDGAWLTFDGYLDYQKATKHYDGHRERFFTLCPSAIAERARNVDAEKERALERKRQREQEEKRKKRAEILETRDPESFVHNDDLDEFRREIEAKNIKGKIFRDTHGKRWQVMVVADGVYFFKPAD